MNIGRIVREVEALPDTEEEPLADPHVTSHTRELGAAAATYGVPLYRDLDAIVSEWGPDRADVDSLTA